MKVVALLSGGKDSCYVMHKCVSYGHEVVAVAHITPPASCAEPDSFMFQSVGSGAAPAIAQSLGLPLYTHSTNAVASVTTLSYFPTDAADEAEDLVRLLRNVREAQPEVDAVCSGALWSDYQRLRVESAASRVGMVSLAYLWRRDQHELLDEMVASGVYAVLVKVAGAGLGEKHLGLSLADMRDTLLRLYDTYGSHVCGEGGEYETLVLDAPLFQYALRLPPHTPTTLHADDAVAPVSYLAVSTLETAPDASRTTLPAIAPPPERPLALRPVPADLFPELPSRAPPLHDHPHEPPVVRAARAGDFAHVSVRTHVHGERGVAVAADAMRAAIARLVTDDERDDESGEPYNGLGELVFVWLRLDSLTPASYASANAAYTTAFNVRACTPPPARACIASCATGYAVTLDGLCRIGRRYSARSDGVVRTLHVQSISEWAPPCIGPYAQVVVDNALIRRESQPTTPTPDAYATIAPDEVHICGVVPLHAPTANIPSDLGVRAQTRACVHNMRNTLDATEASADTLGLLVVYVVVPQAAPLVEDELRTQMQGFNGPIAIIPADALPKRALVELRAVGVVDPQNIVHAHSDHNAECADNSNAIRIGRLWFHVIELSTAHSLHIPALAKRLRGTNVLSVDLYVVTDDKHADVDAQRRHVEQSYNDCGIPGALTVSVVDWLAHDATLLVVATAVATQ